MSAQRPTERRLSTLYETTKSEYRSLGVITTQAVSSNALARESQYGHGNFGNGKPRTQRGDCVRPTNRLRTATCSRLGKANCKCAARSTEEGLLEPKWLYIYINMYTYIYTLFLLYIYIYTYIFAKLQSPCWLKVPTSTFVVSLASLVLARSLPFEANWAALVARLHAGLVRDGATDPAILAYCLTGSKLHAVKGGELRDRRRNALTGGGSIHSQEI